ncbi:hypothetical protein ACIBJF_40310 [Streptomyces sp. NPDC050743]|uniref:hypothetical protein n=1 Tax=Streptomyces sp. NPDC050743 TaxID=3365634 RepID=UPI00379A6DB8
MMMTLDNTQRRIAEIVRLGEIQDQVFTEFNWAAIEGSLGLALPADYKLMAESLPAGQFAGQLILIRPGDLQSPPDDYLGFYRGRLDNMRTWREAGHGDFPYAIHPETGGVLPWGRGPDNGTYFWVTSTEDPNEWPVVHADPDFIQWTSMSGNASDVVISLMEQAGPSVPAFRPLPELVALSNAPLRSVQKVVQESVVPDVVDGSAELRAVLRVPELATGARQVDWNAAEKALGMALPSDYKSFIDSFGPGALGDITVVAPYGPPGFDLFALLEKKREEAALLPPRFLPPSNRILVV